MEPEKEQGDALILIQCGKSFGESNNRKEYHMDVTRLVDVEVDGIDTKDAPKFCDAFIKNASITEDDGTIRALTDEELESLTDDEPEFVHDKVIEHLY